MDRPTPSPIRAGAVALVATIAAPSVARACTVCGSDRGEQLRASILGEDPLGALAGVVSPFVILLGAAAVARFGLPAITRSGRPAVGGRAGGAA